MMTKPFLLSILFVVAAMFSSPDPVLAQHRHHPNAAKDKDMAAEILKYVNEHRARKGLEPLVMNEYISQEAQTHSHNMATGKVPFSHDGFDDRAKRIKAKLKNINSWAENVAFGTKTARQVVDMWLNSPGHKKNIEGHYNATGLGIAKGPDGSLYFTQIFVFKRGGIGN